MSYRERTPTAASRATRSPSAPPTEAKYDKPRIHLLDTCYICGNNFSKARVVVDHVRRIHGYELPVRRQGYKRPQNKYAEYVRERNGEFDHEEIACPSCWFHCPKENLKALNDHTRETHHPEKVDISKEDEDDYIPSDEKEERPRPRRASTASASGRGREKSATPSNGGDRTFREGSVLSDEAYKEITGKLDELANIFKTLFNNA